SVARRNERQPAHAEPHPCAPPDSGIPADLGSPRADAAPERRICARRARGHRLPAGTNGNLLMPSRTLARHSIRAFLRTWEVRAPTLPRNAAFMRGGRAGIGCPQERTVTC